MKRLPPLPLLLALGLALLLSAWLALASGPLPLGTAKILAALGLPLDAGLQEYEAATVLQLRLPRLVLALLVGSALACAGATMQGLFRNPLAEPGLAGISGGAALGAVGVIVLGSSLQLLGDDSSLVVLPLAAFLGGSLAALLVAGLARIDGHTRIGTLLLGGLAVNAITGAGIGFLAQLADDLALRTAMFWMFGSLGKAGWPEIAIAAPLLLGSLLLMIRDSRALDALLLGEAEAGHLGIDVERLKRRLLLVVVLSVSVSVAVSGIIGFVGLVTPHLIRLWAGPGHRFLLPASALFGALLLTLADVLARTLLAPSELAIGVITTLIGGPFFLFLLLGLRRRAELL
ncbi:iron ABC transporter permease [Solimonas sp. K1W22B-7]|uniref:FecCD family ABC transporter permease n=1 Tax=Solimonas sp. K1W22B-7 TaxID=2303331 RepID=UPI000E33188F|nr:iron ABC transporter permease [Solimonas sp. K1W22B-7]AXQ31717.1 iron ABC transporter permease [Solimonas sp. K1W22B-7]